MNSDRIEKKVLLKAPCDRVWNAIADAALWQLVRRGFRKSLCRGCARDRDDRSYAR